MHTMVLSHLEYLNGFLAGLNAFILSKLQSVQSFAQPYVLFICLLVVVVVLCFTVSS